MVAIETEVQSYWDTWGKAEALTIGFSIDGWVGLVEVIVETMMVL